ncbi:hypothetical protein ACH4K8_34880 [Streptomyces anulatus]
MTAGDFWLWLSLTGLALLPLVYAAKGLHLLRPAAPQPDLLAVAADVSPATVRDRVRAAAAAFEEAFRPSAPALSTAPPAPGSRSPPEPWNTHPERPAAVAHRLS